MQMLKRLSIVPFLLTALLLSTVLPHPARAAQQPEEAERICYKPLAGHRLKLPLLTRAAAGKEGVAPSAQTELSRLDASAADRSITGTARWTDRRGAAHPLRYVRVELRAGERLLAEAETDVRGAFRLGLPKDGETQPLRIRLLAAGPGGYVRSPAVAGEGSIHFVDSAPFTLPPRGGLQVDVTSGRDESGRATLADSHTAFSVYEAIAVAAEYVGKALDGKGLPAVEIRYPDRSMGTTCFSGGKLHIIQADRWDWDILQHEYSHFVQEHLGISESPGGQHRLWQNLSEKYGKSAGIRLAWGEGWATYFPVQVQRSVGAEAWAIPGVGDTVYEDTEDQEVATDLAATGGDLAGEDNEMAVARVLWQMAQSGLVGTDSDMLKRLMAIRATTLSTAYRALTAGRSPQAMAGIGCILSANGVAPSPKGPAGKEGLKRQEPPTFRWVEGGGGRKFRLNLFRVTFFDGEWMPVYTSGDITGPVYKPEPDKWALLRQRAAGGLHWVVQGVQADPPQTGPYVGCNASLTPDAR